MILKAIGQKEDSGFNETPAPAAPSQAPSTPAQPSAPAEEPAADKGLVKINTQTIIIALVIVVFFLLLFRPAKVAA
jgi:hypothetical protein